MARCSVIRARTLSLARHGSSSPVPSRPAAVTSASGSEEGRRDVRGRSERRAAVTREHGHLSVIHDQFWIMTNDKCSLINDQ